MNLNKLTKIKYNKIEMGRIKSILYICTIFLLSGCSNIIQGYRFTDKSFNFNIDQTTAYNVRDNLGEPTIIDYRVDTNQTIFIYASEEYSSFLFVRRYVTKRRIEVFYFDNNNILKDIRSIHLDNGNKSKVRIISINMKKPNKMWALPFYSIV